MFQPKELDFLFERKDENGNYISRDELVSAIIDWVDQDNVRYGMQGGDENQLYDRLSDPYAAKNHFLDSVEEMRLIWGVDDRFWEIFGDSFTIYRSAGGRSININTADAIVLEGLLRQCTNTTPTWNQIHMTLDQILKYRDQESMGMGFNSGSDFEQLASTYTQFEFLKGCLSKNAKTESNIFRIKATGEVGQVSITYEAVVDKNGVLYYFRIL
jgi:type II secretory pathway component PulK